MRSFTRSVVIHGHFYQPPREDPWLGELEAQGSAAPFHDWNARVEAECYRSVVAARIPGEGGRIRDILNTLFHLSFNFGPTLLDWMERSAPDTYRAVLEADHRSRKALGGHGNALAQAYHHTILPLASRRDKTTEVRWGVADFRRRFGRDPEGLWLPETAVDAETLDVLAQEGLAFTIVAPHQVAKVPEAGLPGLYRTHGGRTIALFVYDGALSHDVAFGALLKDSGAWASRIAQDRPLGGSGERVDPSGNGTLAEPPGRPPEGPVIPRRLVSMATDGETYGHHHRFGEMALASVLLDLQARPGILIENFASFLAHSPPEEEVDLLEPTSWSCAHGVERWRSDCGCKMEPGRTTQQEWRAVLRGAMDWLVEEIHGLYEREAPELLGDPWEARDEFSMVATGLEALGDFLSRRLPQDHTPSDHVRAAELLEMERNALRLFTSCGWFFDDLAGIEPVQVLRYAARAIELSGSRAEELERGFLRQLEAARSNEAPPRDGATVFLEEAKPKTPAHVSVAAGAMAVHRAQVELPEVRGFEVSPQGDGAVLLTESVTGRTRLLGGAVVGVNPRQLEIRVRALNQEEAEIPLAAREYVLGVEDLPEAFRVPLEESTLREALGRWVLEADQAALLAGRETLSQILNRALVAAVRNLAIGAPPDHFRVSQVEELADLHTGRNLPIPFDAQTEFHRLLTEASPQARAVLSTLRKPLGFVYDQ